MPPPSQPPAPGRRGRGRRGATEHPTSLGHASYQSTQRYSHLAADTLLATVETGARKLEVDWTAAA